MPGERIVAIGLLTKDDLDRLGGVLVKLWPVEEVPCFTELLRAIDAVEAEGDQPRSPEGSPSC